MISFRDLNKHTKLLTSAFPKVTYDSKRIDVAVKSSLMLAVHGAEEDDHMETLNKKIRKGVFVAR